MDIVRILLAHKADVNAQTDCGLTPLHIAVWNEEVDVVRSLCSGGASPSLCDSLSRTPIHLAAKKSNMDCVRLLLDQGADLNCRDSRGSTPLHYAVSSGQRYPWGYLQYFVSGLLKEGASCLIRFFFIIFSSLSLSLLSLSPLSHVF
jgi:ankyrin repeat protein